MSDGKPRKRRGLLGFYVGAGVLLALTVGGAVGYRPLRLRYVVHKLRSPAVQGVIRGEISPGRPEDEKGYVKLLTECAAAARRGNHLATDTLIYCAVWEGAEKEAARKEVFGVINAQPELFFEMLDRRSDERVLEVLGYLFGLPSPGQVSQAGGYVAFTQWGLWLLVRSAAVQPDFRKACVAALAFYRRRFARKLEEEEKAAPIEDRILRNNQFRNYKLNKQWQKAVDLIERHPDYKKHGDKLPRVRDELKWLRATLKAMREE